MAARRIELVKFEVEGQIYESAVKIARDSEGMLLNISAEFEDCKKNRKKKSGIPVKEVMRKAEEAARKLFFPEILKRSEVSKKGKNDLIDLK